MQAKEELYLGNIKPRLEELHAASLVLVLGQLKSRSVILHGGKCQKDQQDIKRIRSSSHECQCQPCTSIARLPFDLWKLPNASKCRHTRENHENIGHHGDTDFIDRVDVNRVFPFLN